MKDEEISEAPYLISKLKKMPAAHHQHRKMTAAQRAAEEWGFAERTVKGEDAVAPKKPALKAAKKPTVHAQKSVKSLVKRAAGSESEKGRVVKAVHASNTKVEETHAAHAQIKKTGGDGSLMREVLDPWHVFA